MCEGDHRCFQISIRRSFPGQTANLEAIYIKKKKKKTSREIVCMFFIYKVSNFCMRLKSAYIHTRKMIVEPDSVTPMAVFLLTVMGFVLTVLLISHGFVF